MYLSLIFGFGLIIIINGKYLLVDIDVHKNAVLPTNENDNILARCDYPPCYPPPRKNLNQKLGCDFPPCYPPPRNNLNQKLGCDFPPCYPPPRNNLNQKLDFDFPPCYPPPRNNINQKLECDFPPCYPPPRKEHKRRMDCIPCLTCPGICTRSLGARAIEQKFNNTEVKKILPTPKNDRFGSRSKVPSCITEQSSCSWNYAMECCDGLFCNNGKCSKRNEFRDDDCSKMKCGENCIVEGDMVGMCNAKQECSFDYDNLGCSKI